MATLWTGVLRVILLQAALTLSVSAVFAYTRGPAEALSALYGGGCAMLLSAWLGRTVGRLRGLGSLYAGAVTRYALAVVCLGLGLGALKLAPLPLIVAFAAAQFGFLAGVRSATDKRGEGPD
jgi:ATP synthase protein I